MRRTVPARRRPCARRRPGRATIGGMHRSRKAVLAVVAVLLAACDMDAPGGRVAAAPAVSSTMEFEGGRPCVDCLGIDAWLQLEHDGGRRRYRLVEHYRGAGNGRRFEEAGEWIADGDLLRLRNADGGERVYARLAEGSLQARDSRGQPLPAAADDVMMPVNFATVR